MATSLRLTLCALALTVPAWLALQADPPSPRTTGKVLLLKNGHALEGDVRLQHEEYCVRRQTGELWLPAARVLRLCADWDEAYSFQGAQLNPHDPDDRLKMARWCIHNGLRTQALAEVTEALRLRPEHAESKRLRTMLQRE